MSVGELKYHNKKIFKCIFAWLIFSFIVGILLSLWMDNSFMKHISFVDESLLKDKNKYYSTMICILTLSPLAFYYVYKYCLSKIILEGYFYYLFWLIFILGFLCNTGFLNLNIKNSQDNYKSTVLFRAIIQQFDWIGAVFVSFLWVYMMIIAGTALLKHYELNKNK